MTVPPELHDEGGDDGQEFDPAFARELIGKLVLVGITYYRRLDRTFLRCDQFHGRVTIAEAGGIKIELEGKNTGTFKWLPPQTDVFEPAAPGFYELHDAQDTVDNPDYIAMWNVYLPDA